MPSPSSFTFADPKVSENPYPYYEHLRASDPVHFDEGIRMWLVTRHEDIVAAARNTTVFSDEMKVSSSIRSPFQAEVEEYMKQQGFMVLDPADSFKVDGELHARRRKLVAHAFTGPVVAGMEARVAEICRARVAQLLAKPDVDMVRDYAMPIPILVICDALGLPMDRVDEISRGADAMVAQIGSGASREEAYKRVEAVMQLHRFAREAIAKRRVQAGPDLISQLVQARDEATGETLTERELMGIVTVAIAGGVDTTRNGIAFACHALASNPTLFERLKNSPDQEKDLSRFCEETLRFYSPVPNLPRVATQDTELGGKQIPKGSMVFLAWASGNRDPQRFANPDVFDIDRPGSMQHLAFGVGVHICLGAMLARQEIKCAMRELVNSIDAIELAVDPDKVDMSGSMVILRGLKSLPVRLRKRVG